MGYAQGSLRRTFEIARNHLDFFAFTPHAHWHDIGHYENNIEEKWLKGFAVTRARWPQVLQVAREFDQPGKFVCLAGYEWHSASAGDYHVLFPDLDAELKLPDDLRELQQFAKKRGCILTPHHPALRQLIDDVSTKAVVLKVRGGAQTRLTIALDKPARTSLALSLGDLAESSETLHTGPFPKESGLLHRLVFHEHYTSSFTVADQESGSAANWYYVRVAESNGQLAWSSPIWVEAAPR